MDACACEWCCGNAECWAKAPVATWLMSDEDENEDEDDDDDDDAMAMAPCMVRLRLRKCSSAVILYATRLFGFAENEDAAEEEVEEEKEGA